MSMTVNPNLYNAYMAQNTDFGAKKKEADSKTDAVATKNPENEAKQPKLSQAAQNLLEKLRNTYDNIDFMAADFKSAEEAKSILSRGTKEISVLFSTEELEKMASDEKYEKEYMDRVQGALRMSNQINEQFGYESAFGKNGGEVTMVGVSFHADGTMSLFAELEKSSADQKGRLEKAQAEKRAQKKEEAKKVIKEKADARPERSTSKNVKRMTVQADSMEELFEKIQNADWSSVPAGKESKSGRKFDFSV